MTGAESPRKMRVKGIGLMSGGLDSMLAVRVLLEQDVDVIGVTFRTPFFGSGRGEGAAGILGIPHRVLEITDEHLLMVKDPKHGYGRNMNPCIDCHAMMFRIAGDVMVETGAQFLFSGEVLGQRPMSQNIKALKTVETEAGYEGRILRPLSAKLLPETEVERAGLVDRSRLLDIHGRSRKRQMELAEGFGLREFPSPGGGCLLTDPGFSVRLRELFDSKPAAGPVDVNRLKVGRHFRLPGGGKLIVGRHKADNDVLEGLFRKDDLCLKAAELPGPVALLESGAGEADVTLAAAITARYGKGYDQEEVAVEIKSGDGVARIVRVTPAAGDEPEAFRIG